MEHRLFILLFWVPIFENVCREYRNGLQPMGTVSPGPECFLTLPTLLSGSTLPQFSEKTMTLTALSCIAYSCLSLEGELFCSQLIYVFQPQALFLCQSDL